MRISDWSSDVCSSDLQDQRKRFLYRVRRYRAFHQYHFLAMKNIRIDGGQQDNEGSYLDADGRTQRPAAYEHKQEYDQCLTVVQLCEVYDGKAHRAAVAPLHSGGPALHLKLKTGNRT